MKMEGPTEIFQCALINSEKCELLIRTSPWVLIKNFPSFRFKWKTFDNKVDSFVLGMGNYFNFRDKPTSPGAFISEVFYNFLINDDYIFNFVDKTKQKKKTKTKTYMEKSNVIDIFFRVSSTQNSLISFALNKCFSFHSRVLCFVATVVNILRRRLKNLDLLWSPRSHGAQLICLGQGVTIKMPFLTLLLLAALIHIIFFYWPNIISCPAIVNVLLVVNFSTTCDTLTKW